MKCKRKGCKGEAMSQADYCKECFLNGKAIADTFAPVKAAKGSYEKVFNESK